MKKNLLFILLYFIFWIAFFELARLCFILYNFSKMDALGVVEILKSFYYGISLDMSMSGYYTVIPILIMVFFGNSNFEKTARVSIYVYTLVLLIVNSFLVISDAKLYQFWEVKLNLEPVKYIDSTGDALAAIRFMDVFLPFILIGGLIVLFHFLYRKLASLYLSGLSKFSILSSIVTFAVGGLVFFPIRGGIDLYPTIGLGNSISSSVAYYSKIPACNHASLNSVWYCMYTLTLNSERDNPYVYYDKDLVGNWMTQLKEQKGKTIKVLKTSNPNIVFIVVESLSANVFGPLGGLEDATPRLNEWSNKGLLFEQFYTCASRSDRGLSALITGVPSMPQRCIMEYPNRYSEVPFLYKSLESKGYGSSFFYGGDMNFVNFQSFFTDAHVNKIVGRDDISKDKWKSKWGVPDDQMLDDFYNYIDQSKGTSIHSLFTLSSHHPFDIPVQYKFGGKNDDDKYKSSIYFTDSCLGKFLDKASHQKWWDNTLVIIVADHSIGHFSEQSWHSPNRFHIPMIWTGGALKKEYVGTKVSTYGSQVDFGVTLLSQLNLPTEEYKWGKNILSKNAPSYAYYSNGDMVGFVADSTLSIYNYESKLTEDSLGVERYPFSPAKAYFQAIGAYFSGK